MRELRRNHAMFTRWRESMSPDDLLEADLRTVLGTSYSIHGARWKRRLALRLPQATTALNGSGTSRPSAGSSGGIKNSSR